MDVPAADTAAQGVNGQNHKQQDSISPGAPAPNKNLIWAILCRVTY